MFKEATIQKILFIISILFATSFSFAQSSNFFINDLETAKQIASEEGKLVALLFACGDG